MTLRDKRSVGEIVSATPAASTLFDILGIDYVCRGNLTLDEACVAAGVDSTYVRRSLEQLPPAGGKEKNWLGAPVDAILHELRDHRHPNLQDLLRRTGVAIADLRVDDGNARRIENLRKAYAELCDIIAPHVLREEHVFFPLAQHLDDCWARRTRPEIAFVGGTAKAVAELVLEHERICGALNALGTAVLAVSEVAGATESVVNTIALLEHELHEHMHIENNVLFPRLAAIEVDVLRPSEVTR